MLLFFILLHSMRFDLEFLDSDNTKLFGSNHIDYQFAPYGFYPYGREIYGSVTLNRTKGCQQ